MAGNGDDSGDVFVILASFYYKNNLLTTFNLLIIITKQLSILS
jgi:hypothetical protein